MTPHSLLCSVPLQCVPPDEACTSLDASMIWAMMQNKKTFTKPLAVIHHEVESKGVFQEDQSENGSLRAPSALSRWQMPLGKVLYLRTPSILGVTSERRLETSVQTCFYNSVFRVLCTHLLLETKGASSCTCRNIWQAVSSGRKGGYPKRCGTST